MPPKRYTPAPFCPTISVNGSEEQVTLSGENMWLRTSRFGSAYAEGYSGSQDLSESIATKTLTVATSITTTAGSKTVTGVGTAFTSELHLGSFVFIPRGAQGADLMVVEKIVSDTVFTSSRAAQYSSGGTVAHVLPVIFPVGTDRGTLVRGNAVQFPRGHYLAVGDGTLRINGTALNATLAASRTPRFALYDSSAGTYTQDDVGIAKPLSPITLTAVAAADTVVTGATNASPIVISTAAGHHLYNTQKVNITGVGGNTNANGDYYVKNLTATTFSLYTDERLTIPRAGNAPYTAGGTINGTISQMRAGGYNIRVCAKNTKTLGYSQPTDAIAPVAITAPLPEIQITFNSAMVTDQDAYDIYGSPFQDNSATTIEARYMGPWYLIKTVTAEQLKNSTFTTGREISTVHYFSYNDGEVAASTNLLSFNNFTPVDAEFVDLINGIPLYFSCLGKGTATRASTSPGPACVPSKPSNPEGVFLNKAITTAGGDTIIGEFNAKSRIYVLCQNSLQTLILTTLDEEPITFRSLWNCGFRNPYNVAFVKEYLYGFGTQKIVRSVAGGDDSTVEFEFASDVRDLVNAWATGHVLVGYDPKNRAVCFFYTAAELRGGRYVTKVLPFLLDQQVWNPPIILSLADRDCIVSGVATIDDKLVFIAGGETDASAVFAGTYVFDGGDSQTKDWYLAWNFSDDGEELHPKMITGFTATGRFTSANTAIKLYGIQSEGSVDYSILAAGTSANKSFTIGSNVAGNPTTARKRFRRLDWGPMSTYTIRVSGSSTGVDRLDEIVLDMDVNSSET